MKVRCRRSIVLFETDLIVSGGHRTRIPVRLNFIAFIVILPRSSVCIPKQVSVAQLDRASASEAEGCGFDPRPGHLSKALQAMTLEPRALQRTAAELCLIPPFNPPTNALLSAAGRNRATISAPAFCADLTAP